MLAAGLSACAPALGPSASSGAPGVHPISTADPLAEAGGIAAGAFGVVWFDAAACGCIEQVTPNGPGRQVSLGLGSDPRSIASGPQGTVWVAANGALDRIRPDGNVTRYAVSEPLPTARGQIAVAPDGTVWFASGDGVGRLRTRGSASSSKDDVVRFTAGFRGGGAPRGLAIDAAGGVWFAGGDAGLGHVSESGSVSYQPVAVAALGGVDLVAAGGEQVWFAQEDDSDQVHRLTLRGSVALEGPQTVPIASRPDDVQATGLAALDDGTLWFTGRRFAASEDEELVGSISGGGVRTFPIAETGSGLGQIAIASDGALWVQERQRGLARLTPGGALERFVAPAPLDSIPDGIAAGADGNVWLSEPHADQVVRVTPEGEIGAVRNGIVPNSEPTSIAAGPDGALWAIQPALESSPNRIGEAGLLRVTTRGVVTSYPFSATGARVAGSPRPGGSVWFTETYGSPFLGRALPSGQIVQVPYSDAIPSDLAVGPADDAWGTVGTRVVRVMPSGVERSWDVGALAQGLCWGDGALWIAGGANGVARLSSGGQLRWYATPAASDVQTVAVGSDGSIWFTGVPDNLLGRLLPDGTLRWYELSAVPEAPSPTPSASISIAPTNPSDPTGDGIERQLKFGPGGSLWLTRSDEPSVDRIDVGALQAVNPTPAVPAWAPAVVMVAIALAATGAAMLWRRRSG